MVKLIPNVKDLEPTPAWVPNSEEQDRGLIIHPRIDALLEARQPYEPSMKRALLLVSNKNLDALDPKKERVVAPFARIFVESKTAEEVRAMKPYEFVPGKDPSDTWKTEFVKDVDEHIQDRTKMRPKKIQAIRMKNIVGVSILRVGYRKVMRVIKDRIEGDEDADLVKYRTIEVPVYDDLFIDLVSPLNFAVDPNATTMDDAMDCVHFHAENWEAFYETYANDKRFKNVQFVRPGVHGRFTKDGRWESGAFRSQKTEANMVLITEYFNKIRDEWCVLANGVEIYYGPLPDDHKELPFISYHNNPNFVSGYITDVVDRTATGEESGQRTEVRAEEGFWTEGDPTTIMDLIDLRTGFTRAAYRAIKRAGEYIVATATNFMFDESRPWKSGDQAVGAMGKYQVDSLGSNEGIQGFQFAFDDLMNLMILSVGTDPRSLAENKTKTATEAAIQHETSRGRLEAGIEYNEENGEVRLGTLIYKLMQQRYSKPELVRLTGMETEEELKKFDDWEEDPETGLPYVGKRFRTIQTNSSYKETRRKKRDGTYKYYLTKSEEGGRSFLARPEFIRSSDIHVKIKSGRRAGEIRAIRIEQSERFIDKVVTLYQLAIPQAPGMPTFITPDDLPNLRYAIEQYVEAMGGDPDKAIGQSAGRKKNAEEVAQEEAMKEYSAGKQPINPPVQADLTPEE